MKAFLWVVGILVALGGIAYGGRNYATRVMNTRAVTPRTLGANTPATAGLPFSRVAIESGDHTLIGWWVRARADSGRVAPAVLFFHGNRSSISDYVDLQRFFYRQGISSLVFDYSGFGASGGSASLASAIADAGAAARVFADSAGSDARRVAMGTALGGTVLLQAIDSVQPHVSGIIVEGTDASIRESAVRAGHLPGFAAPLMEELGDNVAAASRVRVPVLVVHSGEDNRVPFTDAERVAAAVPARVSLVKHWRKGHSGILTSTRPCDWAPVLAFIRDGTLPAAKLDTTNACEVEAQRLAEQARADSAKNAVTPAGTMQSPQTKSTGTGSKTTSPARPARR